MELSFWLIYDMLKEEHPYIAAYHSSCAKIKTARIWHQGMSVKEDVLYLVSNGSETELAALAGTCSNLIILSDIQAAIPDRQDLPGNIMLISSKADPEAFFWELLDQIEAYQEWYLALLKLASTHQPVSDLLHLASEKLDNPVALFDASGNLFDWEGEFHSDWKGTIWEPVMEEGYAPASFYTAQEWRSICERMLSKDSITVLEISRQPNRPIISLGVIVHHEIVATIGTMEINAPFTQGQISLIEVLRDMLVTAFCNSENNSAISKNSAFYLEKLILGEHVDKTQLHYYLLHRGWSEQDRYRILCIDVQDSSQAALQYLSERIFSLHLKGILCKMQTMLVFLINEKEYPTSAPNWKYDLEKVLRLNKRQGILSDTFSDIQNLRTVYQQCQNAWNCLQKCADAQLEASHCLREYKDFYPQIIRDALLSGSKPGRWCHPLLLELSKHPLESQADWMKTLYLYLLNGRNIAKTAKQLYIHRNSLVYRLQKIEKYLGTELDQLEDAVLLQLLISCILLLKEDN